MDQNGFITVRIELKSDTEVFAANAVTPAGGVDLRGVIESKFEGDEQLLWHGHARSGAAKCGMAFRVVGAFGMFYFAWLAVGAILHAINHPQFQWADALAFAFVALSQMGLACWILFDGWRRVVDNRYTLYAISNKRAFKVRPVRSFSIRFPLPDNWEIRTFSSHSSPANGTEYSEAYKVHAEAAGQDFLAEFRTLPGAKEALDRLKNGQ
jgi:hypothetical protein